MKKIFPLMTILLSLTLKAMGDPTFLPTPNAPMSRAHVTPNQLSDHPPTRTEDGQQQRQEERPSLIQEGPDQQRMPPFPGTGEKIK
jgi:hypothetical protein